MGCGGHLPGCVRPRGGCDVVTPARPVVGLMLVSDPDRPAEPATETAAEKEVPVRGSEGRRLIQAAPGGVSRTMLREATPE